MSRIPLQKVLVIPLTIIVLMVLLSVTGYPQGKGNPNPGVLPPHSLAHGSTLGEWLARYYSWSLGFPRSSCPLFLDESVYKDQSGSLFFLSHGARTYNLTIPRGKSLFIPVRTPYWCAPSYLPGAQQALSYLGYDISRLTDEQVMQTYTHLQADLIEEPFLTIDGVAINDPEWYRIDSTSFYPYVNEGYGVEPGVVGPCSSSGHALILPPLPPGLHVLVWGCAKGVWKRTTICNLTVQ